MELALNLLWLVGALTAFLVVPARSRNASFALLCALALLFPIVSISDDLSADRTRAFNEAAAIIVLLVLLVTFIAVARLREVIAPPFAIQVATPSDPRSPPAR
jgi:hypothetical protein